MKRVVILSIVIVSFGFVLGLMPYVSEAQSGSPEKDAAKTESFNRLVESASQTGQVRVIIGLNLDYKPEGRLREGEAGAQRRDIKDAQSDFLSRYNSLRAERSDSVKLFDFIPFLAFQTDLATLQQMRNDPQIASIEEDVIEAPHLAESTAVVGAPAVWAGGFNGSGWAIAILDTGVQKTHSFLTGKVVSEACFSSTNGTDTFSVCPGGVTSSTAVDSGVNCDPAVAGCNHGTHVAGIAAGTNASFGGVARGSNVISIQVFSRFDSATTCGSTPAPCVRTFTSDQIRGLERVLALSGSMNIAAVNMSLGGGNNTASCDATQAARKAAIDNLRSVNIATVISSGNDGFTNAMGAPACISSAISVGSTGDGSLGATLDSVSGFSNSASFLSLLAPGQWIASSVAVTSGSTTTFQNFSGTSMAAPHVAGAFAVLRQRKPNASVSKILGALSSTGLPITDSRNNLVKPRIRLAQALEAVVKNPLFDYDGDGRADVSAFRPSNGVWYVQNSSGNPPFSINAFGLSSDSIAPADFDGDGKTDVAVFRESSGNWYWLRSSDGQVGGNQFGLSGDKPVAGDYDGDGKADVAVFRPSSGTWWISRSSDGGVSGTQFGTSEDIPTIGDFDGDGKSDVAIYRPSNGVWYRLNSGNGQFVAVQFGTTGDKPTAADFDGDGKTDVAVFRPSNGVWYVLGSTAGFSATAFGTNGDKPVAADYDGDGKSDVAVFRPSNGTWYLNRSTAGFSAQQFGTTEDRPTPNASVP